MKKYIFRLEPVLKIRKLKEENCRMELGRLIIHLNGIEEQIVHENKEINNYYEIQEDSLKEGMLGNKLQAFSMLIIAKERNLLNFEIEKKNQLELIVTKKNELAHLRGELKVLENLKQKDFDSYKLAYNKDLNQKVEEQTQNWLQHNEKKG
jgi:flagellar FliJ protein